MATASTSTKQLIVITGASSGIGEATAKVFVEQGHPVLMLARREDRLTAIVKSLTESFPDAPTPLASSVDVTDMDAIKAAILVAEEKYGPVSLLVNNAGCMLLGDVATQKADEWKRMLDVNVIGVLNGIQAVLSGMIERKEGTVINVSSIAGFKAFPNHAAYCGTKYAVHGITETIRQETSKHGLRHILVSPGVVSTELLSHTTSEDIKSGYESWKESMGHPLVPVDVANVILFAYQQPKHVCLREIVVGPTYQDA